jgi:membrane protein YqaA with SNARE-associated domain
VNLFDLQSALPTAPYTHRAGALRWFAHFGTLGVFAVAILDSSVIPLPLPGSTDLLVLWLVSHGGSPWLIVPSAVVGSVVGGYTTWRAGRKGGQAALRRYVPAGLLRRICRWVGMHPILAVFIFPVLPPPIPLIPLVLASGALGVPRNRFLVAYGAARSLRYALVAWLADLYGRNVVRLWAATLREWAVPALCLSGAIFLAGLTLAFWKWRSSSQTPTSADQLDEPVLSESE